MLQYITLGQFYRASILSFQVTSLKRINIYRGIISEFDRQLCTSRARVVEASSPDAPDSPAAAEVSDTEVLLRWKQPKYDGNSPVVCYGLQYKQGDSVEWQDAASNIDHEFYLVRDLKPDTSYQFRLSSRNR